MTTDTMQKMIIFEVAGQDYALPLTAVKSIERSLLVTRVPNTGPFVKGVASLRGIMTPVLDMRALLGKPEAETEGEQRILIVASGDVYAGLLTDSANELLEIDRDSIQLQDSGIAGSFMRGVVQEGKRIIRLLDHDEVLAYRGTR
ncbi:chemotaxis protein CheW [Indiicoccus explosivorum]|uniref:chemotaxis protein CheW n=1 Tax=Indiicoccus explosivorum TaxID=1917864 RepID=UPI000B44B454|nr:chemotaxis protein CheW [Indiicoccus explosivorum]